MRTTELTGITERSALLRHGLETLIRVESAKRLAALGELFTLSSLAAGLSSRQYPVG